MSVVLGVLSGLLRDHRGVGDDEAAVPVPWLGAHEFAEQFALGEVVS